MMSRRQKRFALIMGGICVLAIVVGLVMNALNSNIALYILPSDVAAGKAPKDKVFRIGGMVKEGSLQRLPDGVSVNFTVTDGVKSVLVEYKGPLPDLFKEGKGVVTQGRMVNDGAGTRFVANEVLAKHDENYMPPEAAAAMLEAKKRQQQQATPQQSAPQQQAPLQKQQP